MRGGSKTPTPGITWSGLQTQAERKMPSMAGPSAQATIEKADKTLPAVPNLPVKALAMKTVDLPGEVSLYSKKRAMEVANIDVELAYHLQYKALLQPRDKLLIPKLKMYADQYLSEFDCSSITSQKKLQIVTTALTLAMNVSEEEQLFRASLKNYDQQVQRWKVGRLLTDGFVGNRYGTSSVLKRLSDPAWSIRKPHLPPSK